MRSAKDFFKPLAVGAPTPITEVPARPSRMLHFFDPSNEKMAAKIPGMVGTVDVLVGNLEDAVKADRKEAARAGLVEIARATDFGAHTQPPVLYQGHFYSHYTINERADGLVAMALDGQIKWKTDQDPPFVRGGSILAEGLLLTTDGNTKLYLVEPTPSGFKPLASAVVLAPGDNWAPLALVNGTLLVRGQKQLKALKVAR